MNETKLKIIDLHKEFDLGGGISLEVLKGIDFEMNPGDFFALMGASGSGKSTLLNIIGALVQTSSGKVEINNQDISHLSDNDLTEIRRYQVGWIFQNFALVNNLTALENVMIPLNLAGKTGPEVERRSRDLLQRVGLGDRIDHFPDGLSGGQKQRVAITCALANDPPIILANEPTGNLDHENTQNVMGMFKDLHTDSNSSFLLVTHSQHVANYASRSVELIDGRFTGQHSEIDVDDLMASREIIINDDGSLNLPPEMLGVVAQYGNLWGFTVTFDNEIPRIVASPSSVKQLTNCPVCKT